MDKKPKGYAKQDLEAQRKTVLDLEKIVADTEKLEVLPIYFCEAPFVAAGP